jgi:hypothetical protein
MKPTAAQSEKLYEVCYWVTERLRQPIHIVRLDERTKNLYIQFGSSLDPDLQRDWEITPAGEVL